MPPPRFAADAMLGRLARWLRVLGFDSSYDAELSDPDLVRLANEEGRVLPPPLDEEAAEHGSHVRRMREALERAVPGWLI